MTSQKAFTLIEAIVYLLLFSIVIGGSVAATYQIIDSANKSIRQAALEQEGHFLLKKFDWALTGADSVTVTPATLSLAREVSGSLLGLTFVFEGGNVTLQRNSGSAYQLNSSSVVVSEASFSKTEGEHGNPSFVTISFQLAYAGTAQLPKHFALVKYL